MKTIKNLFKADGRSFISYEEVEEYAGKNGYRITNTRTVIRGKLRVHFIDLGK